MIKFDTKEEAREYVNRWVDEQPAEDLRSIITDFVLWMYGSNNDEVPFTLNPDKEVSGADCVEFTDNNLRSLLEVDEMLMHASKGRIAEPGSRQEDFEEEDGT